MSEKFEAFAIVELFGHQIIAGMVTEQTIGSQGFVRVDVPELDGRPGFTKFYGSGAIYGITPCDEKTALEAVRALRPQPVQVYIHPALRAPADDGDEED